MGKTAWALAEPGLTWRLIGMEKSKGQKMSIGSIGSRGGHQVYPYPCMPSWVRVYQYYPLKAKLSIG